LTIADANEIENEIARLLLELKEGNKGDNILDGGQFKD
jgi:hypothetical protein